jgi:glycosyltransferase involved in cell wall biosynthesis
MLAQFYPPIAGGEERHVQALAAALVGRGHEVDVLTTATPSGSAGTAQEAVDGVAVRVHRVRSTAQRIGLFYSDRQRPHATPFPDRAISRAVGELLATGHHDVVHAHDWIVQSALAPARRASTPVVLTLHDYGHVCATQRSVFRGGSCPGPSFARCSGCAARHYGAVGPMVAAANRRAAARRRRGVTEFLPVSTAVANASGLSGSGLAHSVVPNFIPGSLLCERPPDAALLAQGPVLYAGDVTKDKGVEVLLDAYRLLDAPPDLVLAGRPVVDLGPKLPPGVKLLGVVDHPTVMSVMSQARLVVLPSICPDACPTVILEAMASGRPVVASATGGIVDLVVDGATGRLVRPGDPAALAEAIAEVLADPQSAAEMGRAGLERVRGFTASVVVERVEAAYSRAVGHP